MNDVREFAYKIARELSAKSIALGIMADGTPEGIARLDIRSQAVGYSGAAVMVMEALIEAIEAEEQP